MKIYFNGIQLQHECRDGSSGKSKKKKHKKEKDSDAEDDANVTLLEPETIENIKENETGTIVASSVEDLRANDDVADDDRLNDPNSKKYVFFDAHHVSLCQQTTN